MPEPFSRLQLAAGQWIATPVMPSAVLIEERPFRERRNALENALLAVRDGRIVEVQRQGDGWMVRLYRREDDTRS
jgi:hypothetical protein